MQVVEGYPLGAYKSVNCFGDIFVIYSLSRLCARRLPTKDWKHRSCMRRHSSKSFAMVVQNRFRAVEARGRLRLVFGKGCEGVEGWRGVDRYRRHPDSGICSEHMLKIMRRVMVKVGRLANSTRRKGQIMCLNSESRKNEYCRFKSAPRVNLG